MKTAINVIRNIMYDTYSQIYYYILLPPTSWFNSFCLRNTFWINGRNAFCCCCLVANLGFPIQVQCFCEPMKCSPPGSSFHGIFWARIVERVTISFFRGSSWLRDWIHVSCNSRRILYHWATIIALSFQKKLYFDQWKNMSSSFSVAKQDLSFTINSLPSCTQFSKRLTKNCPSL